MLEYAQTMHEIQIFSTIIADMKQPDLKRKLSEEPDSAILDMIIEICAKAFYLPEATLTHKTREGNAPAARQTIFWLARKYTKMSLKPIGQRLNRDHSTVVHGVDKINDLLDTNDKHSVTIRYAESELHRMLFNKPLD